MASPIATSYVDRIFADKDLHEVYWVISVVEQDRELPEEFWLFSRVFEWAPSRSGIWQYYETLSDGQFNRVTDGLERFGLLEIAEKYRLGRSTWNGPTKAAELDQWLDAHAGDVHDAVFRLIADKKDRLTNG